MNIIHLNSINKMLVVAVVSIVCLWAGIKLLKAKIKQLKDDDTQVH